MEKILKISYILMRKGFVLMQRWSRGNSFMERVFQPRAVVESPFLEEFKIHVDVALGDTDQWWPWGMGGFDNISSFSNLNNSLIF